MSSRAIATASVGAAAADALPSDPGTSTRSRRSMGPIPRAACTEIRLDDDGDCRGNSAHLFFMQDITTRLYLSSNSGKN